MMSSPFPTRNRSVSRVPKNPLDEATIISAYPKALDELKPTLQPGRFQIPAAPENDIVAVTFGPSSWFKELGPDEPLLEIVEPSTSVARSIIDDYCLGLLACDMSNCKPALFWVAGRVSKEEAKKKLATEIASAVEKQKNWFRKLSELADAFWIRTNGNPMSISDDMRLAARKLNLLDKPWLSDTHKSELIRCVACSSLISSNVIVCPNCKVILDEKRAAELNLKFAK
jgi:hypothetical protein